MSHNESHSEECHRMVIHGMTDPVSYPECLHQD